jgi:hypothetical protein
MASMIPIVTISLACKSSGVNLFLGFIKYSRQGVFGTGTSRDTLRRITFWLFPVLKLLAGIPNPALITATAKSYCEKEGCDKFLQPVAPIYLPNL